MIEREQLEVTQLHDLIDAALARQRPFGDSDYIKQQFQASYKRRSGEVAAVEPAAKELLDALEAADEYTVDRTLSDTAVRTVIDHARRRVASGEAAAHKLAPQKLCRDVVDAAGRYAHSGAGSSPLALTAHPRLGPAPHHPWIWSHERDSDAFGRGYLWLVDAHYGGLPKSISDAHVSALQTAAQLLEDLVPRSAASVLRHTQVVAIIPPAGVWERMQSSSQYLLGGNIFLSELVLDKPWLLAELIYHESIHQKLYDFRRGHLVLNEDVHLDPDLVPASDVAVISPWNYPDNQWDTHRVLAAFHVYVHVAHLGVVADHRANELETRYGPRLGVTPTSDALDRARYLGEQLKQPRCWDELGPAGQKLVDWLLAILHSMDAQPAPPGAQLHLYLNRYAREAARLEQTAATGGERAYQANLLAFDEAATAGDLLDQIGHTSAGERLRVAAASVADRPPNERFKVTRKAVIEAVQACSSDGYTIPTATRLDPTRVIINMIERSSRLLSTATEIDKAGFTTNYERLLAYRAQRTSPR